MHKRILFVAALAAGFIYITASCNKLDTTDIGSNLIPPVDNVKTFDTVLDVNAAAAFFADSAKVTNTDDLALGYISTANDPIFGKTTANIFAQWKPNFYPYYLGNPKDTIQGYPDTGIDSIVVCLAYKGYYGDSTTPQKFELREILSSSGFKDSTYDLFYRPAPSQLGPLLGSTIAAPRDMRAVVKLAAGRDSVQNQLRIRITNPLFLARFGNYDSSSTSSTNAFNRDSLWREAVRGFSISADSTNGAYGRNLWYCNLSDAASRIEVHYRKRPGVYNAGKPDTSYSILPFALSATGTINASAFACNMIRTWQGAEIASPAAGAMYIQSGPGTADTLRIPGLSGLPNSIIHRAELIMEQIPGVALVDQAMVPPNYMYLDLVDSPAKGFYRPFPIDLNPDGGYNVFPGVSNINYSYFGGYLRYKNDAFGNRIGYYNFNVTRHVQGIVTRKEPNKTMRLYAPFELDYTSQLGFFARYRFINSLGYGRVKLGDGTNPNYKLRLRIVYSKI